MVMTSNLNLASIRSILKILNEPVTGNKDVLTEKLNECVKNLPTIASVTLPNLKQIASEIGVRSNLNKGELISLIQNTLLEIDGSQTMTGKLAGFNVSKLRDLLEAFGQSGSGTKPNLIENLQSSIEDIKTLTLTKLKIIAKNLELKITGNKSELINRILDFFGIETVGEDSVSEPVVEEEEARTPEPTIPEPALELSEEVIPPEPTIPEPIDESYMETESFIQELTGAEVLLNQLKSNDLSVLCSNFGIPQTGSKTNKAKTIIDHTQNTNQRTMLAELLSEDSFYILLQLPDEMIEKLADRIKISLEQDRLAILISLHNNLDKLKQGKATKARISKQFKKELWTKYCGEKMVNDCWCCKKAIDALTYHAGHILAEANGGPVTLDNLRPICTDCNVAMGTENMKDYANKVFPDCNKFNAVF
jgi:hypothetical protein